MIVILAAALTSIAATSEGNPLSACTSAPGGETVLTLPSRSPLAVLLLTPGRAAARVRSSDLIRLLGDQLAEHTASSLELIDPLILDECRGSLSCVVQKIAPRGARHLLVLSNVSQDGLPDLVFAMLVDVELARESIRRAPRGDSADALIEVQAVLARSPRVEIDDATGAERFFSALFQRDLRPALDRAGDWEPYGALELEGAPPGGEIRIDDAPAGVGRGGLVRICGVKPGRRKVTVEAHPLPAGELFVTIERAITARAGVDAGHDPDTDRAIVAWSGAGVAVVGAALVVIALAVQDDLLTTCVVSPGAGGACPPGRGFLSASYADGSNPPGVLLAPLGYSMMAAGGLSLAGAEWMGDLSPWWSVAAGVTVGVLSYGLSAALDR